MYLLLRSPGETDVGKNWLLARGERAEETRERSVGEPRQDFEGRRSVARVALPTLTQKLLHRRHAKVNVVVLQGQEIITALNIKLLEPLAQGASRFEKLLAPQNSTGPHFFQMT